jgi:tRNA threonylcarbamoyladenosine modification (KEOPS) complex  Pcc1 subunit
MKTKAVLHLKFPSDRYLEVVYKALTPETVKPATSRSKVSIEKDRNMLVLKVEGKDTVALRATLNAYLRWVSTLFDVFSMLEPHLPCKE